ncbi:patatin-like phospholipase family protein [Shimia sp.]|uniref:patatin-like phospholipase family protein n=1 Tax=Shimia sp. TaxID=1954381 RepID=UPI0032990534
MDRRRMLLGMAALSLSGCAGGSVSVPAVLGESEPDPLARFRFGADASADIWTQHLHVPTLRNAPQILALSAGAEDGAFGAGALCGLSNANRRPDFDIVTGVSTGALIAPFAFLGPKYDDILRRIFTDHEADDIMHFSGISAVSGNALYDTAPLAQLIKTYTPDPLLDAVARRHDAGGRLFVATSNLETSRAVVWNMGTIAKAKDYGLFRAILRASGALPGLFSPVTIRFDTPNRVLRETHVDGGVHMQVLATPKAAFSAPPRRSGGGHLYLLINNTLTPAPQVASATPLGISQQALTAMTRASAATSVNTARLLARRNDLAFSVASVSPDVGVVYDPSDRFSSEYMAALFQHGNKRAATSHLWEK